jgi:hypothetical protein
MVTNDGRSFFIQPLATWHAILYVISHIFK